jgi:hypothetical protein
VRVPDPVAYAPRLYPSGFGFEVASPRPGSIVVDARAWFGGPARPVAGRFVVTVRRTGGPRGRRTVWAIGVERPLFREPGVPQLRADLDHYEIPFQFQSGSYEVFVEALDGASILHRDGTTGPASVGGHTEHVVVE